MTSIDESIAELRLDAVIRDDTLSFLVDAIAYLLAEVQRGDDRIEEIWARGEAEARLQRRPYPAGPFGMACFRDEGEARFAWVMLEHLTHGDDRSKWAPFPSLPKLASTRQRRRRPAQPGHQEHAKPQQDRRGPEVNL